jgi:DNA repair exonuclease SbcCD ATPase subunit
MNASQVLRYLDMQKQEIQALIEQLDEIQVAFNAQFDEFKAQHDAKLDHLTNQVTEQMDAISPKLRAAIEERVLEEYKLIDERRRELKEEHLPKRQQAADSLLAQAQAELGKLYELNPQLDAREEELKSEKAGLEGRLAELNDEIRQKSRGLGVVRHFIAITKADRERHRILGKMEAINSSLYTIRRQWERQSAKIKKHQPEYEEQWQLECIATARLQSELDQLNDEVRRKDLALQRAIHHVLDTIKEPLPGSNSDLDGGLQEMIELNIQTDNYHEGLASVGGFIGLLRGIDQGLQAIRKSISGLQREQRMHGAYLRALNFQLPTRVETFHKQWPALAQQFANEKTIGTHPTEFSANTKPLLEGPLSQSEIEAMFNSFGTMISRATARWK